MSLQKNTIYNMDCLEGMAAIPDKSIDLILCDLPYGTTTAHGIVLFHLMNYGPSIKGL